MSPCVWRFARPHLDGRTDLNVARGDASRAPLLRLLIHRTFKRKPASPGCQSCRVRPAARWRNARNSRGSRVRPENVAIVRPSGSTTA